MKRLAIFAFIAICLVAVLLLAGQEPVPAPRYIAWVMDPSIPEAGGADHPTSVQVWVNVTDPAKAFGVRIILDTGGEYLHPHHAFREAGWHDITMRLGVGDKVQDVEVTELTPGEPVTAVVIR